MLVEDGDPSAHELVVVGFVSSGALEGAEARRPRDVDPDLGYEHSLEVETRDEHAACVYRTARERAKPRLTLDQLRIKPPSSREALGLWRT